MRASIPSDVPQNTVDVDVESFDFDRLKRNFYTSSSCGVCGKGALEAVAVEAPRVGSDLLPSAEPRAAPHDLLRRLPRGRARGCRRGGAGGGERPRGAGRARGRPAGPAAGGAADLCGDG